MKGNSQSQTHQALLDSLLTLAVVFIGTALFLVYAIKPWEWGIMDDTTHLKNIYRHVHEFGLIPGILKNIAFYFYKDTQLLGFIRYTSWVYCSLVILFSALFFVASAYVSRKAPYASGIYQLSFITTESCKLPCS